MHHVISSFLTTFMPHQTKAKLGQKAHKYSQNVMLIVIVSTMAYSFKQWKIEWVHYHVMKRIYNHCGGDCNS
jgi:hypothetical protein